MFTEHDKVELNITWEQLLKGKFIVMQGILKHKHSFCTIHIFHELLTHFFDFIFIAATMLLEHFCLDAEGTVP